MQRGWKQGWKQYKEQDDCQEAGRAGFIDGAGKGGVGPPHRYSLLQGPKPPA